MTTRRVPPEFDVADEVPEADAAEQHTDIVEPIDPAAPPEDDEPAEVVELPLDDERVVVLDDDEYR